MTYAQLLEKIQNANFTMGKLMKIQRHIGFARLQKLDIKEEDIVKLSEEEQIALQEEMMNIMVEMVYIIIGSPKDMEPEDVAELIPIDKMEELMTYVGEFLNKMGKIQKN